MARTLIVSHETLSSLLEAHVSLAAWYYRLAEAVQAAGGRVEPPDEAERRAFLAQLGTHFPEIASVAASIEHPRPYLPPPAFTSRPGSPAPEGAPAAAPADSAAPAAAGHFAPVPPPAAVPPPPRAADEDALAPPPLVDPTKVRYQ